MTPIKPGTAKRLGLRGPLRLAAVKRWSPGSMAFDAPPIRIPGHPWRRTKGRLEQNMRTMSEGLSDLI